MHGLAERGDGAGHGGLVIEVVQRPEAAAECIGGRGGREYEHRARVVERLRHRGERIREPGPADERAHPRPAGDDRPAVGHEARTLLMTRGDGADSSAVQPAVQLDVVHTGDAEHCVDPVLAGEQIDHRLADAQRGARWRVHDEATFSRTS